MPKHPMGEAWFMGEERAMYWDLMHEDPQQWPTTQLDTALEELTSGPGSFGPMDEWTRWFHFLLPRAQMLIDPSRSHLHEALVSATFVHCIDPAMPGRSPEFRRDLLDSLGRTLLTPACWKDGRAVPYRLLTLVGRNAFNDIWIEGGSGLAASCCLVLKYLDPELIDAWLASVLVIEDPYWRAAFVLCLAGMAPLILDGVQPDSLDEELEFAATWNGHWLVHGATPSPKLAPQAVPALIDAVRGAAFVAALRRQLDFAGLMEMGDAVIAPDGSDLDFGLSRWQYDNACVVVHQRYGLR